MLTGGTGDERGADSEGELVSPRVAREALESHHFDVLPRRRRVYVVHVLAGPAACLLSWIHCLLQFLIVLVIKINFIPVKLRCSN